MKKLWFPFAAALPLARRRFFDRSCRRRQSRQPRLPPRPRPPPRPPRRRHHRDLVGTRGLGHHHAGRRDHRHRSLARQPERAED